MLLGVTYPLLPAAEDVMELGKLFQMPIALRTMNMKSDDLETKKNISLPKNITSIYLFGR